MGTRARASSKGFLTIASGDEATTPQQTIDDADVAWRYGRRHCSRFRSYCSKVRQNLLGQWVVLPRWGRVSAKQGRLLEHVCDRYEEGLEILEVIEKCRAKRVYSAW